MAIVSTTEGGKSLGLLARLLDRGEPRCTSSMACSTVSASVWLPIASRATLSDATSGTPAPTSVPSMRAKRTRAKWAMTCPSDRQSTAATVRASAARVGGDILLSADDSRPLARTADDRSHTGS